MTPEQVAKEHRYEIPVFCLVAGVRQVHVYSMGRRKGYCVQALYRGDVKASVLVLGGKWQAIDAAFELAVQKKVLRDYIVGRARARVALAGTERRTGRK